VPYTTMADAEPQRMEKNYVNLVELQKLLKRLFGLGNYTIDQGPEDVYILHLPRKLSKEEIRSVKQK